MLLRPLQLYTYNRVFSSKTCQVTFYFLLSELYTMTFTTFAVPGFDCCRPSLLHCVGLWLLTSFLRPMSRKCENMACCEPTSQDMKCDLWCDVICWGWSMSIVPLCVCLITFLLCDHFLITTKDYVSQHMTKFATRYHWGYGFHQMCDLVRWEVHHEGGEDDDNIYNINIMLTDLY